MKKIILIVIGVIIGLWLIGYLMNHTKNSKNNNSKIEIKETKIDSKKPIKSSHEILLEVIDKLDDELTIARNGWARPDIKSILDEVSFFSNSYTMIVIYDTIKVDSLHKKLMNLKSKLIQVQKLEFPKMRTDYAEISSRLLWENDIKVKKNGLTLTFIGGIFSLNKNIKDSYEQIRDAVTKLRFQRVNFKWYSGASEYTYYTTNAPGDDQLIYP